MVQLISKVIRNNLFFTFFFLLIASNGLVAQQLHTYVDTDSVSVGDRFTYTIVFDGNYNSIIYPEDSLFEPELEWVNRERFQLTERRDSLVYSFQFFGTEDLTIERKPVQISTIEGDTTLFTVEVPLFFKTVIESDEDEFRSFKPLFEFARNWFLIILLILFIATLLFFFYRWYQNREIPSDEPAQPFIPPDPFVSPLELLQNELSDLSDTSKLSTFEDYERFYVRLGDAIRSYLKQVYSFPALEMTTREIINSLHQEVASSDIITITRKVLNEADMVKFANFQPTKEQAESVLKRAKTFTETAAIVDNEKIRYMKYKYEEKHGLRKMDSNQNIEE